MAEACNSQPLFGRTTEQTNSEGLQSADLAIADIDKKSGSVLGGEPLWIRCAQSIPESYIRVIFSDGDNLWEADGVFSPSNIYAEILIILKTPAYHNLDVETSRKVHICLCDRRNGVRGPSHVYSYTPIGHCDGARPWSPTAVLPGLASSNHGQSEHTDMVNGTLPPYDNTSGLSSEGMLMTGLSNLEPKALQDIIVQMLQSQHRAIMNFAVEGDPTVLLQHCRSLISLQDDFGNTALHLSCKHGQSSVCKNLLKVIDSLSEPGAVDIQNKKGQTALHVAIRYNQSECVHYLISSGASRSLIDTDGNTVAHLLAEASAADIYNDVLFPPPSRKGQPTAIDLNLLNNAGVSPLQIAVKAGRHQLVDSLLEAQAAIDVKDSVMGYTALHYAVLANQQEIFKALLQARANPNATSITGATPLHIAVENAQEWISYRLVQAGADPTLQRQKEGSETDTTESCIDMAGNDEKMLRILNSEEEVDDPESYFATPETSQMAGSIRDTTATSSGGDFRRSSESPDQLTFSDDVSSLDYLTRLRLSKLLDIGGWEQLAASLGCEHMIEPIKCIGDSSPTILFLDQYEQMSNSSISNLMRSLDETGYRSAVELILKKRSGNDARNGQNGSQDEDEPEEQTTS